jgi:hypothetical protein
MKAAMDQLRRSGEDDGIVISRSIRSPLNALSIAQLRESGMENWKWA